MTTEDATQEKRARVFRRRSFGFFNLSEQNESRNETPNLGKACQLFHKTQGFVGNTVRLRALVTPTDIKHRCLQGFGGSGDFLMFRNAHNYTFTFRPEGCFL